MKWRNAEAPDTYIDLRERLAPYVDDAEGDAPDATDDELVTVTDRGPYRPRHLAR